jgi:uncharacterized protein YndB with AHSA1/START domain
MDEVSVHVSAPVERVWELVTDVTQMGRWSPECTGGRWTGDASGPVIGAHFTGANRHGWVRWSTHCRVVSAEEPVHFSFEVRESAMRWGYRLEQADGGTLLTEYRETIGPKPLVTRLFTGLGLAGSDREGQMVAGMRATLERVRAAAES